MIQTSFNAGPGSISALAGTEVNFPVLASALLAEQTIYWALLILLSVAVIAGYSQQQNRRMILAIARTRHDHKQLKFRIMQKDKNPVIITAEDYRLLKPYVDKMTNQDDPMTLAYEINRAIIVKDEAFPVHTVKLNSRVSVLDLTTDKVIDITIVMPEKADMRNNRISILTPMSAALIGFRKGEEVSWKVPLGIKRFRILDVVNERVA